MDVEREFAAVNRRIRAQIDSMARDALIRIGIDVEGEERAERERQRQEMIRPWAAFGAGLAELKLGMERFAQAVGAGYEERMRRG